jgi:HK97 gp10 family phage protein
MARRRKWERVDLDGVEDLEKALKTLNNDTQGVYLRKAAAAGAEITRSVASQLAPRSVDGSHGRAPGFLAENIDAEVKFTRTQDKAEVHVGMKKDAWYGRFAETGTQFAAAQPFLRPALDATKDDVIDEIRDQLRRQILKGL